MHLRYGQCLREARSSTRTERQLGVGFIPATRQNIMSPQRFRNISQIAAPERHEDRKYSPGNPGIERHPDRRRRTSPRAEGRQASRRRPPCHRGETTAGRRRIQLPTLRDSTRRRGTSGDRSKHKGRDGRAERQDVRDPARPEICYACNGPDSEYRCFRR